MGFNLNLLIWISRQNKLLIKIDSILRNFKQSETPLKIPNFVLFGCENDDCRQTIKSYQYSLLWQYA